MISSGKSGGDMDLDEEQNDDEDKEMEEKALDDDKNNIIDKAARSLPHDLLPDLLRNIGILRSTPVQSDYLRNQGIMRSSRSFGPESIRITRSSRLEQPHHQIDVGIKRSPRSIEPDYVRNIGIMRSTRSGDPDYLTNSRMRIMRSRRSAHLD